MLQQATFHILEDFQELTIVLVERPLDNFVLRHIAQCLACRTKDTLLHGMHECRSSLNKQKFFYKNIFDVIQLTVSNKMPCHVMSEPSPV